MRPVKLSVIAALAVIVQITYLAGWRPLGVVPNLALIVVTSLSLNASSSEALWVALGSGVVLDLASGTDFGLKTAVLVVVTLFISWLRRGGTNLDSWWLELILVAGGSVLAAVSVLAALAVAHAAVPLGPAARILAVETGANVIIAAVIRPVLIWLVRQPVSTLLVRGGL